MPAKAGAPKHVSPFTIITLPQHPHAFFDACTPSPLIHLRQRHPLEAPAEKWNVRFRIATFATNTPSTGAPASAGGCASNDENCRRSPALQSTAPRIPSERFHRDPVKLRESRRARRAREKAEREKRWRDYWYGDPDAPRVLNTEIDPRPFARFDSGALARRAEAVRRVIAAPARFARALARRLRKHFAAIPRIVTRLRRRRDEHSPLAMQCIEAALAAPDTS